MAFAVIDLETTGLHPGYHHRIVEIGVVVLDDEFRPSAEWETLVNPERDVGAGDVHGLIATQLLDAPVFAEIAGDLLDVLDGHVLVAHNLRFEQRFLTAEYDRLGQPWNVHGVCTMTLAGHAGYPPRLSACCDAIGLPNRPTHAALDDARAASALLAALMSRTRTGARPTPVHTRPHSCRRTGRRVPREESSRVPTSSPIGAVLAAVDLPLEGAATDAALSSYLDVLSRCLEDRVLTEQEARELALVATDLRLDQRDVATAHRAYLAALRRYVEADGIITIYEQTDLDRVAALLQVTSEPATGAPSPDPEIITGAVADELTGKTVCFTGALTCTVDDEPIKRDQAQRLAELAGLIPVQGVTKKTDILVVADPDSLSGKARKARDYGTRIMAERAFWQAAGITVD